jgi:nicotinamidase-related amidase
MLAVLVLVSAPAGAEQSQEAETKTALLIIDVQEFYFPGGALPLENPEAASLNTKKLLKKFRDEDKTVIHVGHIVSKEGAFHTDVKPLEGEKVIMKDEVSAFKGTDLLQYLKENRVERLVICGMQTHMCVEAAVRAAADLDFVCILVGDACATQDLKYDDSTISARDVHNSTLSSLSRTYARVVDTDPYLKEN